MNEIHERYHLRILKIYNLFLSEQKGGATTDIQDEDGAINDKSAINFKVKSDIKSDTNNTFQPIKSIFTKKEKLVESDKSVESDELLSIINNQSTETDKSAESDELLSIINNQSAETVTAKISEYESKIIELEKGKELDKYSKYEPKIIELEKGKRIR